MGRRLAIFDIDGTIANQGKLDLKAFEGIKHLQSLGYITTLCTGRSFATMRRAVGEHYDELVSDDALIVLEHGTRIVNKQGKTVFAEYLSDDEITQAVDFLRLNIDIIRLSWFGPEDPDKKLQMWCLDPADVDAETEARGAYTDVFSCPFPEFEQMLRTAHISNFEAKLRPHVQVHNLKLSLAHTPLNIIFQDGNFGFLKNNTNKGILILYLLKHLDIAYDDVLVAGDAINDIEMLNLSVGHRILVGPAEERRNVMVYLSEHDALTQLDSPAALGEYLQTLA